jgi:hypothetical protein
MSVVNKLPSGAFSAWSDISVFINKNVAPAASWSGGVFSSISGLFSGSNPEADTEEETEAQQKYGIDKVTTKELENFHFQYISAESLKGANDEALLCSKNRGSISWGACEDYMACMKTICELQRKRLASNPAAKKLKVRLHFAEDDVMIGKGGQKYFNECWQQTGFDESIDVKTKEWPKTSHDSVLLEFGKGALPSVFQDIKTCQ